LAAKPGGSLEVSFLRNFLLILLLEHFFSPLFGL